MKLLPFDLEKALNGAKLVTRDGLSVSDFKLTHPILEKDNLYYPYSATVGMNKYDYTNIGTYWREGVPESRYDLLILDAPDLLPNYKRMYEMLERFHVNLTNQYVTGVIALSKKEASDLQQLLLTAKID